MRASAIVFTGLLVLAAFAPLALGHPGERRDPERDGPRDDPRSNGTRAEKRMDAQHRPSRGDATDVRFSALGIDRENRTYELSGAGSLQCRSRENATTGVEQIHCRGRINATVVDENGTILKAGSIVVMLHAHQNETGEWKWNMLSLGHGKRAPMLLALRGANATETGSQLDLTDGKGGLIAKKSEPQQRLKLRISDAMVGIESA